MSKKIILTRQTVEELATLLKRRDVFQGSLQAVNTQKAYANDWKLFSAWCVAADRPALPASTETVALYFTDLLSHGRAVTTAVRRTSAITHRHREAGYPTPITAEIWNLLNGARRVLRQQVREMQPLTVEQVRQISELLRVEGTRESLRNRAIIVLGVTSALRRSNIVALLLRDVEIIPAKGVLIRIRHEKNDQLGRGRQIAVVLGQCPDTDLASCLRDWLAVRGDSPGPLFTRLERDRAHRAPDQPLCGSAVGRAVKEAVERIGLDPTRFAGHSLRTTFVTASAEGGAPELLVAFTTGHRDLRILRKYFRKSDMWRANASASMGL